MGKPNKKPATRRQRKQSRKRVPKRPIASVFAAPATPPAPRDVEPIEKVLTLRQRRRMERQVATLDRDGDKTIRLRDYRFYELPMKTGWNPLWPWTVNGCPLVILGEPLVVYDWWTRIHSDEREGIRKMSRAAGMRDKPWKLD